MSPLCVLKIIWYSFFWLICTRQLVKCNLQSSVTSRIAYAVLAYFFFLLNASRLASPKEYSYLFNGCETELYLPLKLQ